MERKRIQVLLLAASIVCFVFAAAFFLLQGEEKGLLAQTASEKKMVSMMEKMTELSNEESLSFSLCINDVPLPCDRAKRIFYLPVDTEDDLWQNGTLQATDGVKAVFWQEFGAAKKTELVKNNEGIAFLAVTSEGYQKWTLLPVGLPILDLQAAKGLMDGEKPLYRFRLLEAAATGVKVTECLTSADLRGNTSLTYEKKSLRLRLKREKDGQITKDKKKLLGMRKDDDWILNSLYADPSRLRDKLCMDLWQETGAMSNPFGVEMGVRGEFVEVLIGEGYTGLYLLSYPVDRKLLGMEKVSNQLSRSDENVERIYKKKYTAPLLPESFRGDLPDPGMPDFRGGYYLKGDTILQNEKEWESLYILAEQLQRAADGQESDLTAVCDQGNVLETWLFYQAIGGFDNENKNHYYVTRNTDGKLKGYFIPWDMNISFGCVYEENAYFCAQSMEPVRQTVLFEPGETMFDQNIENSRDLTKQIWQKWRSGCMDTDQLLGRIDALEGVLQSSGALEREMERWPDGNTSSDLSHMKQFTKERLQYVDELVGR